MKNFLKVLIKLVPFTITITAFSLLAYGVGQQNYRMNANDPQIQIAEDTANALNYGDNTSSLLTQTKIDISKSLGTFVVIYDKNKKPILGTGLIDNSLPTPPLGTFDATIHEPNISERKVQINGENRFTWQPKDDVRIATVLIPVDNGNKGYVLAGRNLKEVEKRVEDLGKITFLAWLITMGAVFVWFLIRKPLEKVLGV